MMAAFEHGVTMEQYRNSPKLIAECFISSMDKYQYDGILVDIDTVTLAGAVGVPVDFPVDDPARSHLGNLNSLDDIGRIKPVRVEDYKYIQIWLEAVRLLKEYYKDEIYIRGIRLMVQTGCDMVSNGDSPAGPEMISPEMYLKYAIPYEKKMVEIAHQAGVAYTLHICGNTDTILEYMLLTGADAFELDYKTNAQKVREIICSKACFIGNIDPSGVLTLGSTELVKQKTIDRVVNY